MTIASSRPSQTSSWKSESRRDQAFALAAGIVCMGLSALCLHFLNAQRPALVREDPESEKTLKSLAVTFPRLTLGGMRGIASTYLWMQAEDDKNDRKWIELESKYTQIGALQPYFASVYIYHSWNQAYNLSAQWQEQETKYKWVLDGIAYLYKGEDFNPANADIMLEESQLYAMKLGGSFERIYYREHWRHDIARLYTLNTATKAKDDATVALQHVRYFINHRDPRDPPPPTPEDLQKKTPDELRAICASRNIEVPTGAKPADLILLILESIGTGSYFHTRELPDPEGKIGGLGWGIALSDLTNTQAANTGGKWGPAGFNLFKDRADGKKATDPVNFRYGVSPFYFAYCEYRRCLDLPTSPTYTGRQVVDSWPAMSLRLWCRDDLYYSYETMNRMFGTKRDAALLADRNAFNAKVEEIHDCFRNVQMIAPRAVDLFVYHLDATRKPENYAYKRNVHEKHMEEVKAYVEIGKAENRLFDALVQWSINGEKLNDKIQTALLEADKLYEQANIATLKWVETVYPARDNNPDRADFEKFANSLQARRRGITSMIQAMNNNQKPDMSFLEDEVVER